MGSEMCIRDRASVGDAGSISWVPGEDCFINVRIIYSWKFLFLRTKKYVHRSLIISGFEYNIFSEFRSEFA